MPFLIVLQVIFVLISGCYAADLPSNIPQCSINDPEMGDCILKVANLLRPRIREGINEIGIPSYDPLFIPYLQAIQESNLVNYTHTLWNFTIRGLDNYDIIEIQYDPKTLTFKGKLQVDPVSFHAVYNFTGKLLFVPIRGIGNLQMALGPTNGTFEITGDMMKLKNEDHYKPKDIKIRLVFDDMSIYLNGLFDGDEELGTMANDFLNRNSKTVVDAVTPAFEQIVERFLVRYFKWLTETYPYYELFPRS